MFALACDITSFKLNGLDISNVVDMSHFLEFAFSLKEFDKTDIEGENLLNSIIETWGEEEHPFSFCYLGEANYEYENLVDIKMKKMVQHYENNRNKKNK